MNVGVVIVCAGKGRRLKVPDKPLLKLSGKPLFYHTCSAFRGIAAIKQIVLVLQRNHLVLARRMLGKNFNLAWGVKFIEGGKERLDSVRNGLGGLDERVDYVLIHDGARPFVSRALIHRMLKALKQYPAVICGVPVVDTLKKFGEDSLIKYTLDRRSTVAVQTPQGFRKDLIQKAYEVFSRSSAFDDAEVVEALGTRPKVIAGERSNFKITYPEDIVRAKATIEQIGRSKP